MRLEGAFGQDGFLKGHGCMRKKWALIAIVALVLVVARGITQKYGPYYGKVVDAETGEPIEKAVVAVWFSTETGTFGGSVYHVEDAVETLTDANGEFRIPARRLYQYKIFSSWDDRCVVSIYKPGYGAYPGNLKSFASIKENKSYFIIEKEYAIYYLPKLLTIEERRKDSMYALPTPYLDNLPILHKYINECEKIVLKMQMEKNK
jgi:hypothetical protein